MHDGPEALAYHYLINLGLADRKAHGAGLGLLEFVEGPHPGNNSSFVTTKSVALRADSNSGFYNLASG
jgi:hypothetical protein